MENKLKLDVGLIHRAREDAGQIAALVQAFVRAHTTVAVERTIGRLLGIDGVDEFQMPLVNGVVDQIKGAGQLGRGIAFWLGNAMVNLDKSPQQLAQEVAGQKLNLTELPLVPEHLIEAKIWAEGERAVETIRTQRKKREALLQQLGEGAQPYLYVIVATGNIYEDVVQAQAAVRQGADIIAVIRSTAQSLLDYVPYGATTEGFGGTFATQENFKIMRQALDQAGQEVNRYIRLCNYCSGLSMPEIAAMGAVERLDMMLNDALYGILFRDINMQRTLVDQYFSRVINGFAGIIINTGEDNYLTTADAVEEAYTVLASQFINEQLALIAGIPEEQMGLGHAFEMDPAQQDGFLWELAQAQMAREIFPKAPLKYMPPTKFMTGNIFKGYVQNALFNLVSVWTGQGIQLLGMLTEAIHTPHLHDRALAIENARYIFNNCRSLGEEVYFKENGIIQKRAGQVLQEAADFLQQIRRDGLFETIEAGKFGGVKRSRKGGKGLEGVVKIGNGYLNPFLKLMGREET